MNATILRAELFASFRSAFAALERELNGTPITLANVMDLLAACSNNTASALADRTISSETADRAAKAFSDWDIEQIIKDEILEATK